MMPEIPEVPQEIIKSLFNLNQGERIDAYCIKCDAVSTQVRVSYSQLSIPQRNELMRITGRILDVVPGMRLFIGKPTICPICKTVNRP
jgi:hypothetical protein